MLRLSLLLPLICLQNLLPAMLAYSCPLPQGPRRRLQQLQLPLPEERASPCAGMVAIGHNQHSLRACQRNEYTKQERKTRAANFNSRMQRRIRHTGSIVFEICALPAHLALGGAPAVKGRTRLASDSRRPVAVCGRKAERTGRPCGDFELASRSSLAKYEPGSSGFLPKFGISFCQDKICRISAGSIPRGAYWTSAGVFLRIFSRSNHQRVELVIGRTKSAGTPCPQHRSPLLTSPCHASFRFFRIPLPTIERVWLSPAECWVRGDRRQRPRRDHLTPWHNLRCRDDSMSQISMRILCLIHHSAY
jgi:hypothetical protein